MKKQKIIVYFVNKYKNDEEQEKKSFYSNIKLIKINSSNLDDVLSKNIIKMVTYHKFFFYYCKVFFSKYDISYDLKEIDYNEIPKDRDFLINSGIEGYDLITVLKEFKCLNNFVLIPYGGFSNRLRAILGCAKFCNDRNINEICVFWNNDHHCNCNFKNLFNSSEIFDNFFNSFNLKIKFENLDVIKLLCEKDRNYYDIKKFLCFIEPNFKDLNIDVLNGEKLINDEEAQSYQKFYNIIYPKFFNIANFNENIRKLYFSQINKMNKKKKLIGFQFRTFTNPETDSSDLNNNYITENNNLELFNTQKTKECNFFLIFDNIDLKKKIIEDNINLKKNLFYIEENNFNRDYKSIEQLIAEILILADSELFFGHNYSSITQIISKLRKLGPEKIKELNEKIKELNEKNNNLKNKLNKKNKKIKLICRICRIFGNLILLYFIINTNFIMNFIMYIKHVIYVLF